MRNTRQKNLILKIVDNGHDHLDAYGIYELCKKEMPNISLGTVYRNLSNLSNENRIKKIKIDGIDRYDKNIPHCHFVCDRCNNIIDIFDYNFNDIELIDGNLVDDYEIKFKGICKKCMEGKDS